MNTTLHDQVKSQFCSTANALTQMFKSSMELEKLAYNEGKKIAYKEIFNWVVNRSKSDLKNLPMVEFKTFLQGKIAGCSEQDHAASTQEMPNMELMPIDIKSIETKGIGSLPNLEMEDVEGEIKTTYQSKMKRLDFN